MQKAVIWRIEDPKHTPMVQLKHVSKTYRMGKVEVPALQDVTLDINYSSFIAVAGPSGSGKSTLLNLIGCVDTATSGDILFESMDTRTEMNDSMLSDVRFTRIGFIFQSFNLIASLNVMENILMGAIVGMRNDRRPMSEYQANAKELIRKLGLVGWENHRPAELSGGQRQRVAIARALVKKPLLVLADEPTANLDSQVGKDIVGLMKQLNKEYGTTFVFATHDDRIMELADQHIRLLDGRIME
ncbi:MAG: ABC transporter ATP-binding protein [Sphaerochaetaceae bacterium]|nr:ABC transporter ATP-binding protein [Sphaerochaetaceae bacterium]